MDTNFGGIIAFVSNGKWLDNNSTDGFRKVIEREFSSVWVLNLRGDAHKKGELRRKEAGNVFGGGTRSPIAITILVKKPDSKTTKSTIKYHDIGDYLSQAEKLEKIAGYGSISNPIINWEKIKSDQHGDWINQRSDVFETLIPMAPDKKFSQNSKSFFTTYSLGIGTNRDAWVYNFSRSIIDSSMKRMVTFYNTQKDAFGHGKIENPEIAVEDFIDSNPQKIAWSRALRRDASNGITHQYNELGHAVSLYRPYIKNYLYFDRAFIESPGQNEMLFPTQTTHNIVICVSGLGGDKANSLVISNNIVDLNCLDAGSQCFPLYYFEKQEKSTPSLFDQQGENEYIRRDGVSGFIFDRAKKQYGKNVTKEDIFFYVYGILHSPHYRKTFRNDLSKMLPRLPLLEDVRDFWKFSKAGRQLADLHINYESVPPYSDVLIQGEESGFYSVNKIRFAKKDGMVKGKKKKVDDRSKIIYNSRISISNIPDKAYEYIVNGQSAIEWIMERYQDKVDSASGIRNNPNDWAEEVGNPRYILDLLLSIINVSVQTVDVINSLPDVKFE